MRRPKDRRKGDKTVTFPMPTDSEALILSERREAAERRLEKLSTEELQLLYSEMPGLDDETE